jgi:hypothetical protein
MSTLYLAWSPSGNSRSTFQLLTDAEVERLSLLVSFVYLRPFDSAMRGRPRPRRLMLDSGAYSAWKSGKTIDIVDLTRETKQARWDESVSLDVIGDWKASEENALRQKALGSPAFPVFHYGEPFPLLERYCAEFPKVGLSCRFGETVTESYRFIERCFRLAWPHRFHSFGWVAEKLLTTFPFHSADTASWNNTPAVWGRSRVFTGASLRRPMDLRFEIDHYLRFQTRLESQWKRELERLG